LLGSNVLAIVVCILALLFVRFLVKNEGLDERKSQPLVGTWKLVDEQTILSDGTVKPNRGSAPTGVPIYDGSGHVASQIFRPNTMNGVRFSDHDKMLGVGERSEYEGYFGTCAVGSAAERITCHVDAAVPSETTGKDIDEQFSIVDSKLTTRSPTRGPDGKPATNILVWTRLK